MRSSYQRVYDFSSILGRCTASQRPTSIGEVVPSSVSRWSTPSPRGEGFLASTAHYSDTKKGARAPEGKAFWLQRHITVTRKKGARAPRGEGLFNSKHEVFPLIIHSSVFSKYKTPPRSKSRAAMCYAVLFRCFLSSSASVMNLTSPSNLGIMMFLSALARFWVCLMATASR